MERTVAHAIIDNQTLVRKLEAEVTGLEAEVTGLKQEVSRTQKDLSGLLEAELADLQRAVSQMSDVTVLATSARAAWADLVALYGITVDIDELVSTYDRRGYTPATFTVNGSSAVIATNSGGSAPTSYTITPSTGRIDLANPSFGISEMFEIFFVYETATDMYLFFDAKQGLDTFLVPQVRPFGAQFLEIGVLHIVKSTMMMDGLKGYPNMRPIAPQNEVIAGFADFYNFQLHNASIPTIFDGYQIGESVAALYRSFAASLGGIFARLAVNYADETALQEITNKLARDFYTIGLWTGPIGPLVFS